VFGYLVSSKMSSSSPKKKRGLSKKTKTSWRKNTNISEVEAFLEDQRLEERLGGSFQNRPNSELFVVDTDGGSSTEVTDLTKRHRLRLKPLKCFQHLNASKPQQVRTSASTSPKKQKLSTKIVG
jgi:nucleolar protein 53